MNVLLLEDEPLELEQLEFLVHMHYPLWRVIEAVNSSQAIAQAKKFSEQRQEFQLGFIDIKLPGKSGLVVAEELREIFPAMQLVIVSACQVFEFAKSSIKLGVIDYLVKPLIEEELLKTLGKYLKKYPQGEVHSDMIQRVIDFVKSNYLVQFHLEEVAKELYINVSYLSRKFSEEMGISFSEYVIAYRLEIAKQILRKHRDWSIQRVAEECGFNSQTYFSNTFRKGTSKTPTEYRNLGYTVKDID